MLILNALISGLSALGFPGPQYAFSSNFGKGGGARIFETLYALHNATTVVIRAILLKIKAIVQLLLAQ